LLAAAESPEFWGTWISVYVILSLLTGARTEELRELRWDHVVAHDKESGRWRPITEVSWDHKKFAIHVWRSVRATGDTKTRKSRRTIALPRRCVAALRAWQPIQVERMPEAIRIIIVLVFTSDTGESFNKDTVLRAFRLIIATAGITGKRWTPRELRHTFVSVQKVACPLSRSHNWRAIARRRPQRRSTGIRSGP
jgi:integrase